LPAVDARRALLGRLIDHAALFPPASMPMAEALAADRLARDGDDAWLLGRFVCPASLLGELGAEDRALTVIADGELPRDPRIESVEAREPVDFEGEVYVEVPLDDSLDGRLDGLAERGLRAKVRCGGASTPATADLARFIRGCRDRDLVFKATAGLHHAYPSGDGGHGFLNLLAAAVFGDEPAALEAGPGSFELDATSFRWDTRAADATDLARARGTLLHSIGSCSFAEPVEELRGLGLLP
jgi:hypothetical protein